MNRADAIKLISLQLQEEIKARLDTARLRVEETGDAFMVAAAVFVMRKAKAHAAYMLNVTGGNDKNVEAVVHYEMTHEERDNPSTKFRATIRDGQPWATTFSFMVTVDFADTKLEELHTNWVLAARELEDASKISGRISDVKPDAWKLGISAVLDNTQAGEAVKSALSDLRKELKRDGFDAIIKSLEETNGITD